MDPNDYYFVSWEAAEDLDFSDLIEIQDELTDTQYFMGEDGYYFLKSLFHDDDPDDDIPDILQGGGIGSLTSSQLEHHS